MQFGTPNAETGMSNIVGTGRADLRFDGTTLKLVAGPVGAPPSALNGIAIGTTGRVGIGTTTLTKAKLQVDGGANDGILGTSVFGVGVSGEGVFGGVRGFTDTTGSRGVYGISLDGTGVEGSSNGGNGFAVFSNGFLGVNRLGTGGSVTLCRNASDQVATCSSSLRYKTEMRPFSGGMNVIRRLRPLSYKWKADHTPDVGFGAEEVAAIDPLFVSYNDKGEVEGVKYDRLSAVFVNAFQAQQAQLERQQRQIARLQRQLRDLQAHADMCR